MNEFLTNLKYEAEKNPLVALGAVAAVLTAMSQLVQAHGRAAGSRAYARDVKRRVKASK